MKLVTGSITASTSWKVPIRMPSGTARTEASAKPTKTTKHEAAMWVQREPSFARSTAASATWFGVGRNSVRTRPLCASSTHPPKIAPTVRALAVR